VMKKIIEINRIRKDITPYSGLIFFENLITRLNLAGKLGQILPQKIKNRGLKSKDKFVMGMYAFICGADCIQDLDILNQDPLFQKLTMGGIASTTMGKFLKSFQLKHIERLQDLLPQVALTLRKKIFPDQKRIVITMDSTPHEQYGEKMEGVAYNYKKIKCLDSQNAFDEYGLCYGWHLRPGNTFSAQGAEEMLERVFKHIPESDYDRYFRADSAYAQLAVYNCLIHKKINFAICLGEKAWGSLLERFEFKIAWHKTKINFFKSNKCQIGSCIYPVKGLQGRSFLRVVFIRTKKKNITKEDKYYYDYYAIVTNIASELMNDERIIYFYRKRANVENFIKDLKYGMDFLHFPSGSLRANQVWGMMGIYAYNLMKMASYILYPEHGCFLKRVRNKMVILAGMIKTHARKITLLFNDYFFKEVQLLQMKIHFCFQVSVYRSKFT